jgi:hypothetical protein
MGTGRMTEIPNTGESDQWAISCDELRHLKHLNPRTYAPH